MKHRFSSRKIAAFTNIFLALIVCVIGAVCFLPAASPASNVDGNLYYRGNSDNGVSLMINVYWGTEEVEGMLRILAEYDAKATFFLGGSWADDHVDCVKKIAEGGHEIGSHGYFHRDHSTLTYRENVEEIGNSIEFISLITHTPVTLFGASFGGSTTTTR